MSYKNIFIALLFSICWTTAKASNIKDSLITVFAATNIDSVKIRCCIDILIHHSDKLELDSALVYGDEALSIAKANNDTEMIGEVHYGIGYAYDLSGKLDKAFDHYEMARKQFVLLDNDVNVVKAMNGKGIAAFFAGDYGKALKYYLETLKYAEDKNMLKQQADLKYNIANIYRKDSTKYQESLDMYLDCQRIRKILKDTIGMEHSCYGSAINYMDMKDFTNAKIYFDSSIYFSQFIGDSTSFGRTYNELGHSYFELEKDYVNAKKYLELAKKYLQSTNEVNFKYRNFLSLGKIDTVMGNYFSAEKYFNEAYNVVKDTDKDELKMFAYELIRDAQGKSGNYKAAYENSIKYEKFYNELKSSEREKYVEELQTEYETEQKEKQIVIQELKLTQAATDKKLYTIILALLALSLMSAIAFLYNKSKTNKILGQQKLQIQNSLAEKDILLREIHHRVKNNLQVISSLLKLQSRDIDDEAAKSALREGQNRVKSMALIHQNLYQEDNLTGVDVKEYFEKLVNNLFDSYKVSEKSIVLDMEIDDIQLDVDTVIPLGLVLNELVSNALKYAFQEQANGRLSITLKENKSGLQLQVSDNGKGMEVPSNTGQQASFGYNMIHTFVDQLDGSLSIDSQQGTDVLLTINEYPKVA